MGKPFISSSPQSSALDLPSLRHLLPLHLFFQPLLRGVLRSRRSAELPYFVILWSPPGGNFCAGYDLKELANHTASLKLEQDVTKGPGPMGPSRLELSKPLIAAVSGFAVAGGLELALLADLRVVEESAVMGVFCRRFGVPLIDGGTVRLPRLIGLSRALDLILTGRPIGAQEALAYGLANRVVPDGQALQEALQLAEQISSFPQQCLRADRSSAMYSCYDAPSFTQAMQYEINHGIPVIQSEAVTGATRFTTGAGRGGEFS
ncbi:probable enoyl-CoA hydratase isoform X3 [Siniperca chuatsi]|uniref:probable enoyl-CoA hydratase isoform X3 n=1 Tax=Siniperca chuatsi TaxID=119488 RepID=UPI001CE1EEB7|nr:probable enoyl-CoA hydratase isoform X3 [Siniperca chuatsi]